MRLIIGLMLFGGGVYLLAVSAQGSTGFWLGFALVALGLLGVAKSGRSRDKGRRPVARAGRRRRSGNGGDGRDDAEGEGDGGGGDGGDGGD